MKRGFGIAVAVTLAVPVVALAALIGEQEMRFVDAETVNVPVRGVDPRDLLRGHYITGRFDWDWETTPDRGGAGGLCILPGDAAQPRARFLRGWRPGDGAGDCRLVLSGHVQSRPTTPPTFVPDTLDAGHGNVRLFVSETRAPELERLIRDRPGSVTVDLAVRRDGSAVVRALRLDGQVLGR